jgi:putative transcriptional regulator
MSKMGQEILEAMKEALDHAEGKKTLHSTRMEFTPVRDSYSPEEIKNIRGDLGMTQGTFAGVIGVSKKTVESWETGRYKPDGAARRLLSVMQQDPSFPSKYHIVSRI